MKGRIISRRNKGIPSIIGLGSFKLSKIEGTKNWGLWVHSNKKHGIFKLNHFILLND